MVNVEGLENVYVVVGFIVLLVVCMYVWSETSPDAGTPPSGAR